MKEKMLCISEDEFILLKELLKIIIKDTEKTIEKEKNSVKKKGLKVSIDTLNKFNSKLIKLKY